MSNGINYKDITVKTKLFKDDDGFITFKLDGFQPYSLHMYHKGEDITYSYWNRPELDGEEVAIDTSYIHEHPILPSEETKALNSKDKISKVDATYLFHKPVEQAMEPQPEG